MNQLLIDKHVGYFAIQMTQLFSVLTKVNKYLDTRFVFLSLLLIATPEVIAANQALQDIRETAVRHVSAYISQTGDNVKLSAGKLDPRLRLAMCNTPLEAYFPHSDKISARTTVGVRCNGKKPWSIYVPVSVQIYQSVVVAAHPLAQRSILTAADVRLERVDINRYSGSYIFDPEKIIGKQLMSATQMGRPLYERMLKAPIAIRRGEKVTVLAKSATFEVRMEGQALADAAIGDKLKVRNLKSKRIVEGKLVNPSTVFIN